MTRDEIKAELAMCDAATPGPWQMREIGGEYPEDGCENVISRGIETAAGEGLNHGEDFELFDHADARFIVHARAGYPRALRELDALKEAMEDDGVRVEAIQRAAYTEAEEEIANAAIGIFRAVVEERVAAKLEEHDG